MYSIESFINYVYEDDYAEEGLKDIGKGIWGGIKKFIKGVINFFTKTVPNFFRNLFNRNPDLKKDPKVQKAIKEIDKTQKDAMKTAKETEDKIKSENFTQDIKDDINKMKKNVFDTQETIDDIIKEAEREAKEKVNKIKEERKREEERKRKEEKEYWKSRGAIDFDDPEIEYRFKKLASELDEKFASQPISLQEELGEYITSILYNAEHTPKELVIKRLGLEVYNLKCEFKEIKAKLSKYHPDNFIGKNKSEAELTNYKNKFIEINNIKDTVKAKIIVAENVLKLLRSL